MIFIETHTVKYLDQPQRLSDYLNGKLESITSRKGIKKAIDKNRVFVNGKCQNTGYWVKQGDRIQLLDIQDQAPKPYSLDLEILFEDEYLGVVHKPAGIPVSGNHYRTLQNAVIGKIKNSHQKDALPWPKHIHRLDSPTSGLVVFGKTNTAVHRLGEMFAEHKIQKIYHAIVQGNVERNMKIDEPIQGQHSVTYIRPIQSVRSLKNNFLTLLEVELETGRTHQIRRHLAGMGIPIFGDQLYGEKGDVYKGKGLFLAATKLSFSHPITKKLIELEIPVPPKFRSLLEREAKRWKKINA